MNKDQLVFTPEEMQTLYLNSLVAASEAGGVDYSVGLLLATCMNVFERGVNPKLFLKDLHKFVDECVVFKDDGTHEVISKSVMLSAGVMSADANFHNGDEGKKH